MVTVMNNRRRIAWILILIVDASFIAWGGMAAAATDHLLGPGGKPILLAGFEGYSGAVWSELVRQTPSSAAYMALLFKMYGIFNVVFGFMGSAITLTAFRRAESWAWWVLLVSNTVALVSAMTYDWKVNAIGPFEVTEYLGLVLVWVALGMTAPFVGAGGQRGRR